MVTLMVTESGARVSVKQRSFIVERGKAVLHRLPFDEVDRVLLFGGVELTSAFVRAALNLGCPVAFLARDGRYRGRLEGPSSKNVRLRVLQILRLQDSGFRLALAKAIVAGKVRNQRALVLRAQRTLGLPELATAIATMQALVDSLATADTVDQVRGLEGAAAAAYFRVFGKLLRCDGFTFEGRNKRPPTDPVNACLSFGYAILTGIATGIVARLGLDPMVGALHDLDYGRPSLVLDLIEEWRPIIVDATVLRLFNRHQLTPIDFGPPEQDFVDDVLAGIDPEPNPANGAVHLRATGRRIFLTEILARLRETVYVPAREGTFPYEEAIAIQAHGLTDLLEGHRETYVPFSTR